MIGAILCFLFLPFLQLGYSYWVSGHIAAAVSMLLLNGRANIVATATRLIHQRYLVMIGMLISVALFPGAGWSDLLRLAREAICFFLISGVAGNRLEKQPRQLAPIFTMALIFAACEFALAALQTYYLSKGSYFGVPQELFVINTETLPTALDLRFSDIRPMGTFGEPSYLAAVCFSVIFALRRMVFSNWKVFAAIALLTLTIFLSRSLSGIVAVLGLWVIMLWPYRSPRAYLALMYVAIAALAVLLLKFDSLHFTRLNAIMEGNDVSFYVRVIAPILAVPSLMIEYPLGIPNLQFMALHTVLGGRFATRELIQNGFFNVLINYGIFGIPLILQLFRSYRRSPNIFYIIIMMFQNGGFLAFDKVALICLAVTLSNTLESVQIQPRLSRGLRNVRV